MTLQLLWTHTHTAFLIWVDMFQLLPCKLSFKSKGNSGLQSCRHQETTCYQLQQQNFWELLVPWWDTGVWLVLWCFPMLSGQAFVTTPSIYAPCVYERVGIVRLEGGYRDLIVQTGPPRVYGNLWVYRRVWKALMACQRHDSKTAVRQSKPEWQSKATGGEKFPHSLV